MVWTEAIRDHQLTPTARLVYANLCCYVNPENGTAFPSQLRMAEDLGISEREVRRCLDDLISLGWIQKARRREVDPEFKGHSRALIYTVFQSPGKVAKRPTGHHSPVGQEQPDTSVLCNRSPMSEEHTKEHTSREDPPPSENQTTENYTPPSGKEISALVDAVAAVCHINPRAKINRQRIQDVEKDLRELGATPDQVIENYTFPDGWWYTTHWIGRDKGSPPAMSQLVETWGQWNGSYPPQESGEAPRWPTCPHCGSEAMGYMGAVIDCARCGQVDLRTLDQ